MDSKHYIYDVFLSYKPKDTLKNFTGHLYAALTQANIRTFFMHDNTSLVVGNHIRSECLKAIQTSKISIIVFSKNYVSSSSCRDELVKILECKKNDGQVSIIPVLYEVKMAQVIQHVQSFGIDLEAAAGTSLSEWDMEVIAQGHEARFIQKIVVYVLLKSRHIKLHVAKHPIGLASRVEYLNSLLRIGSGDVRVVGIYGMGGIGKTTIAKAFFNMAFHLFEGSCFLANIREEAGRPNGIARLQEQLLKQLIGTINWKIANEHIGISYLEERLGGKRVLIVLDDVDQLNQIESLASKHDWFGSGSRIIITTRNEHLLIQARTDDRFEVKRLNEVESMRLFCLHAFQRNIPLKKFIQLSKDVVSYAAGVPLALEVLGSSLLGRTLLQWQNALEKLQVIPDMKIQAILRLSFDALDDDDVKNIFLDIACFFYKMHIQTLIVIFKACGFFPEVGIRILIDKCLLKLSENQVVLIHDLLRDMGRHIVRSKFPNDPSRHSRLWLHKEVCQVLTEHKGTNEIESIILDSPVQTDISTLAFSKMDKLRLLQINNAQLSGSFEGLFKELKWFSWHGSSLESLPLEFHPKKLAVLNLEDNNMKLLWHGVKLLRNLKILNLSGSKLLTATPDFSGTPNLETLYVDGCKKLFSVHPSIGCLGRLTLLSIDRCSDLKSLPNSICNARSLRNLSLDDCSKMEQLPHDLGSLECLKVLHAKNIAIQKLPDSIGLLVNLQELLLINCRNLGSLPNNICNLRSLEWLFVTGCPKLKQLPQQLGDMESLRILDVGGTAISHIPDSLGLLKNLTELAIHSNHRGLVTKSHFPSIQFILPFQFRTLPPYASASTFLPPSVSGLHSLTGLNLSSCNLSDGDIPDELGGLSSLRNLDLRKNIFCALPSSLGQLTSVENLYLCCCWKLQSVMKFPPNLVTLTAKDCRSLENIPDLSNMKFLNYLHLEDCCKLVDISGLENLNCMQEVYLQGCNSLSTNFEYQLLQGYFERFLTCSVYLSRREIPHWFTHRRLASSINFVVEDNSVELSLWVDYTQVGRQGRCGPSMDNIGAVLHNQTSGIKWFHYGYPPIDIAESEEKTWVNYGSQPYPLNAGDRIEVSFEAFGSLKVEKCGIHLAYKPIITESEQPSHFMTEIDNNVSDLAISHDENKVSKRSKPVE